MGTNAFGEDRPGKHRSVGVRPSTCLPPSARRGVLVVALVVVAIAGFLAIAGFFSIAGVIGLASDNVGDPIAEGAEPIDDLDGGGEPTHVEGGSDRPDPVDLFTDPGSTSLTATSVVSAVGFDDHQPAADIQVPEDQPPLTAGDRFELTIDIFNDGSTSAETAVALETSGEILDTTTVEVDANDHEQVTLVWDTDEDDVGEHTLTVATDSGSGDFDLTVEPADDESSDGSGESDEDDGDERDEDDEDNGDGDYSSGDENGSDEDDRTDVDTDNSEQSDDNTTAAQRGDSSEATTADPEGVETADDADRGRTDDDRSENVAPTVTDGATLLGWTNTVSTVIGNVTPSPQRMGPVLLTVAAILGCFGLLFGRTRETTILAATLIATSMRIAVDFAYVLIGVNEVAFAVVMLLLELTVAILFARFVTLWVDHPWTDTERTTQALIAIAAIGSLLVVTNPLHGLVVADVGVASGPVAPLALELGLLGWLVRVTTGCLLLAGFVLLAHSLRGQDLTDWGHRAAVVVGGSLIVLVGVLTVLTPV